MAESRTVGNYFVLLVENNSRLILLASEQRDHIVAAGRKSRAHPLKCFRCLSAARVTSRIAESTLCVIIAAPVLQRMSPWKRSGRRMIGRAMARRHQML